MKPALYTEFSDIYDKLKLSYQCKVSNIFFDSKTLQSIIKNKNCLLHTTNRSVFLLIPYHNIYYDCIYLSIDKNSLREDINNIISNFPENFSCRASIIGKEPYAEEGSSCFKYNGFILTKKLIRMRLNRASSDIIEIMRPYEQEYRACMSFAKIDDAEEILKILKEEFDIVADNIPEIEKIRNDIKNRQIVILKKDNQIASLQYFNFYNNTLHSLYDVTRKEYRREGFFMALAVFVDDYFTALGKKNVRALGWRDAAKQKLVKHARKSNQHPDGVVIYNMLWTPSSNKKNNGEVYVV